MAKIFRGRFAALFSATSPWKGIFRAAAIGWTALIFWVCFVPSDDVPRLRFPHADKWIHGVLYLGFTFLWALAFPGGSRRRTVIIAALACLLGYLIEVLQGAITSLGRSYDNYDLLADATGALAGAILYWLTAKLIAKHP